MNTSLYQKFNRNQGYYQFLYLLLIINIIVVVLIFLLCVKNKTIIKYDGIISNNNILVISNLEKYDVDLILDSKDIKINDQSIKYKVLDTKEVRGTYTLKLELNKYYLDSKSLRIDVLLKEENLYQFIVKIMRGE